MQTNNGLIEINEEAAIFNSVDVGLNTPFRHLYVPMEVPVTWSLSISVCVYNECNAMNAFHEGLSKSMQKF